MPTEKIEQNNERWYAQRIFQYANALRVRMVMFNTHPDNKKNNDEIKRYQKVIKHQIKLWGGKEAVDAWLLENDSIHGLLADLVEIDWSFLED